MISHSLVHVGTLIYASIVYHRYRISKADERRNSNSIQHHARHRTSQLDTTEYQTLDSPSDHYQQSNGLVGRRSAVERERDGTESHRPMQMPWMQELRGGEGGGEVHELATTRSVRSLEPDNGGGREASPIAR